MPFHLVVTKENGSDAYSAVPSGWVHNDDTLYWPKGSKSYIAALRCNENSLFDKMWGKQKCCIKLKGIGSFYEATKLEELYANFEDTEEEELYFRKRQHQRKHPTHKFTECDDLNFEFEKIKMDVMDNNNIRPEKVNDVDNKISYIKNSGENNKISLKEIHEHEDIIVSETILANSEINFTISENKHNDTVTETNPASSEKHLSISAEELIQLVKINNTLTDENKLLKDENKRLLEENKCLNYHISGKDRQYEVIQVKLEKIINLMEDGKKKNGPNNMAIEDEEAITDNLTFPIGTREELERLEEELSNKEFERRLVSKFSKIYGTGGASKCAKIGLTIVKNIIKDELLNQCTWKGIKGCKKTAFVQYIQTRNLLYNIMKLADRSCSSTEVDALIQHSAIKHSGQRMKRKGDIDKVEQQKAAKKQKAQRNEKELVDNILQEGIERCNDEIESQVSHLSEPNVIILTNDMITVHRENDDGRCDIDKVEQQKAAIKQKAQRNEKELVDNILQEGIERCNDEIESQVSHLSEPNVIILTNDMITVHRENDDGRW